MTVRGKRPLHAGIWVVPRIILRPFRGAEFLFIILHYFRRNHYGKFGSRPSQTKARPAHHPARLPRVHHRLHRPREHRLCSADDDAGSRLDHARNLRRGRGHFLHGLSASGNPRRTHRRPLLRREVDRTHHVHMGACLHLHGIHADADGVLPLPLPARRLGSEPLPRHLLRALRALVFRKGESARQFPHADVASHLNDRRRTARGIPAANILLRHARLAGTVHLGGIARPPLRRIFLLLRQGQARPGFLAQRRRKGLLEPPVRRRAGTYAERQEVHDFSGFLRSQGFEALLHLFHVGHRLLGLQLLDADGTQRAFGLVDRIPRRRHRHSDDGGAPRTGHHRQDFDEDGRQGLARRARSLRRRRRARTQPLCR